MRRKQGEFGAFAGGVGFTDFPDFVRGKQSVRLSARRSAQLALFARFAANGKSFAFRAIAPLPKKSCEFSGAPLFSGGNPNPLNLETESDNYE